VTVARATTSIIFEVNLDEALGPNWAPGPYPFALPAGPQTRTTADAAARLTYFHPRTAAALYGSGEVHTRWYGKPHHEAVNDVVVEAVELLATPDFMNQDPSGLGVVHFSLPQEDPRSALTTLVRATSDETRRAYNTILAPANLSGQSVRGTSISFVSFEEETPAILPETELPWPPVSQWLWAMASATPIDMDTSHLRFIPDWDDPMTLQGLVYLSRSWRALVLRDGISFVGMEPVSAPTAKFLQSHAATYVRSIYLDVLLLGLLQHRSLNNFADRLSTLDARSQRHRAIPTMQDDLTRFRNTFWWQHVTSSGTGNSLLLAFQGQHRLPDLLDQIVDEFDDYAQQVGASTNARTGAALGLLTLVGLPLTLVLAADPVFVSDGSINLLFALLLGVCAAALLLLIPAARDLIIPLITSTVRQRNDRFRWRRRNIGTGSSGLSR
jgi:hypothetical protein